MKYVLLDTNFLMIPGEFKVDIFTELDRLGYTPVILSCVVHELQKIASGKGKASANARIGLQLLSVIRPHAVPAKEPADKALLEHAGQNECAIATNDVALIEKAKGKGLHILRLRQRKYVVQE